MKRDVVKIDHDLCNGCGECVPACHEGALQIIDGKAVLLSDFLCDGLGACLGHCPVGAIEIEKREAEAYNETKVIASMISKGKNTVIAHLKHLKDHNETDFLKEGVTYLKEHAEDIDFDVKSVINEIHQPKIANPTHQNGGGCPGAQARTINQPIFAAAQPTVSSPSQLKQWPVQMHLISPMAAYFKESDLVLAADCVAFAMGNFHDKILKDKSVAIACPKLDNGQETYTEKLVALIDDAKINTLTVALMQVPCCMGLLQTAKQAMAQAQRKVPLKLMVISVEGAILKEEWI